MSLPFNIQPSTYTRYEIPQDQLKFAQTYNDLQLANLHNEMTIIAERKLNLKYDIANPTSFMQEEAFLSGQLAILQYLLNCHNTATTSEEN